MSTLSAFIKEPRNIYYDGEDSDEKILYILRRSHLTNLGWEFALAVMAILPFYAAPYLIRYRQLALEVIGPGLLFTITLSWYLAILGLALLNFLNWYFNVYIITNKKIVDFDFYGLTYKNIADTVIHNVQDVTATISGPINMIFNIGHVYIQTAAEKREFDFDSVDDPGKIRDIISDLVAEKHPGNNNYNNNHRHLHDREDNYRHHAQRGETQKISTSEDDANNGTS